MKIVRSALRILLALCMVLTQSPLYAGMTVAAQKVFGPRETIGIQPGSSGDSQVTANVGINNPIGDLPSPLISAETPAASGAAVLQQLFNQLDADSVSEQVVRSAADYLLALPPVQQHTHFRYFGLLWGRFHDYLDPAQQAKIGEAIHDFNLILTPERRAELIETMQQSAAALNHPLDMSMFNAEEMAAVDASQDQASPHHSALRRVPVFLLSPEERASQAASLNGLAREMLETQEPDIAADRARKVALTLKATSEIASPELEQMLRSGIDTYLTYLGENIGGTYKYGSGQMLKLKPLHEKDVARIGLFRYAPNLQVRNMFDLYIELIRQRPDLISDKLAHTIFRAMNFNRFGYESEEKSVAQWVFTRIRDIAHIMNTNRPEFFAKMDHDFNQTLTAFDHMNALGEVSTDFDSFRFWCTYSVGVLFHSILLPVIAQTWGLLPTIVMGASSFIISITMGCLFYPSFRRRVKYLKNLAQSLVEYKAKELPAREVVKALGSFDQGSGRWFPRVEYKAIWNRLKKNWFGFKALIS